MRRPIAVWLALAVTVAVPAAASAASPQTLTIEDNFFFASAPPERTWDSEGFIWEWGTGGVGTANDHNVRHKGLFRSGAPTNSKPGGFQIAHSAGNYNYFCEVHKDSDDMTSYVSVAPALFGEDPVAGVVTVRWADGDSQTGNRYDVRMRGGGPAFPWTTLRSNTRRRSLQLTGLDPGLEYEWKARSYMRGERNKGSEYSVPSAGFFVTG